MRACKACVGCVHACMHACRQQAPPWGRWLDRDTNPCRNFQRIGESKQRPLELCSWKDLEALPPVGKENQQGYELVNDRLPKDQPPAQAPPSGRWLARDTNACLNLQRNGGSVHRPLEMFQWVDPESLPESGMEYHQRYKLDHDRLPKVRHRLHRAAEYRRDIGLQQHRRNNALSPHILCRVHAVALQCNRRTLKSRLSQRQMENPSWLSNYLAPLGMAHTAEQHELKPALVQQQPANKRGFADGRRPALSDITNSAATLSHSDVSKAAKSSLSRGTGGIPQLSQQSLNDPVFADGQPHHDKKRRDWVDVDAMNIDDPQACSAYASAIFQHLRDSEVTYRINPAYLEHSQTDVNSKMRAILIDWLVEVAEEYKLCADTLYLTVNYIDRFLSLYPVQRSQLQLVGVACMWIAAKYEEIYPPNVTDFCYITDNTYSKEQMVQMEETVLKRLSYELTVPTAKTFLRRLLQVCNPDELLHFLSNYLTELSLLDHSMMGFLPSEVAAASVYLANVMLKRVPWDGTLQHYSGYGPQDINKCAHALGQLHAAIAGNAQLAAIREKYAHPRFHPAASLGVAEEQAYLGLAYSTTATSATAKQQRHNPHLNFAQPGESAPSMSGRDMHDMVFDSW
ncbi:hypothetical protein QJQ45_028118 [Haematococcus lacustris]|nr:hypothetical protein QJQ45_028118 [Haematococcus lacustris]